MQTVPAIGQRRPRALTSGRPAAVRGTPSAYPRGTRPRVVSREVTYRWP